MLELERVLDALFVLLIEIENDNLGFSLLFATKHGDLKFNNLAGDGDLSCTLWCQLAVYREIMNSRGYCAGSMCVFYCGD